MEIWRIFQKIFQYIYCSFIKNHIYQLMKHDVEGQIFTPQSSTEDQVKHLVMGKVLLSSPSLLFYSLLSLPSREVIYGHSDTLATVTLLPGPEGVTVGEDICTPEGQ